MSAFSELEHNNATEGGSGTSFCTRLLRQILTFRFVKGNKFPFTESDIENVCPHALTCFKNDSVFLKLNDTKRSTVIIGDLHGQIHDLQRILYEVKIDASKQYLFLGDLVDRGDWSLEVVMAVFLMKITLPYQVFVLRGNHECPMINKEYGFQMECIDTFGREIGGRIWATFNTVFQYLPLCALLREKIFCTHGGISPHIHSLADLDSINRDELLTIPDSELVCDLLWSDPEEHGNPCGYDDNERGCSVVFNSVTASQFCEKFGLMFICRAHQMVEKGYEFFGDRRLVTIFSASNYCGDSGNDGAVLVVNSACEGVFITFPTMMDVVNPETKHPFMTTDANAFFNFVTNASTPPFRVTSGRITHGEDSHGRKRAKSPIIGTRPLAQKPDRRASSAPNMRLSTPVAANTIKGNVFNKLQQKNSADIKVVKIGGV